MGTTGRDVEMLMRLEPRLRAALEIVGGRLAAMHAGAPCESEEVAYCEGFCHALLYLFGTDPEASQLMEEVMGRLEGLSGDEDNREGVSGGEESEPAEDAA